MKFEIVKITPKIAAEWLAKNFDNNRKLRAHRVAYLARAISEGKFVLTHQALAFGKRGQLLDGQHRLRAVVMAGKSVDMAVAYDVPESTFSVMDAGMPRTMAERLRKDARRVSMCGVLFRSTCHRMPHEYEVALMLELYDSEFQRVDLTPGTAQHARVTRAALLAGVLIRLRDARGKAERVGWIASALEALVTGDSERMPRSVAALALDAMSFRGGSAAAGQSLAKAWLAFDQRNESRTQLSLDVEPSPMSELRAMFHEQTEGVFEA